MILPFLFSFSFSHFEKFTKAKFNEALTTASEKPVFALFYLEKEQRSSIVIPRYQSIMDSIGGNSIGFQIECAEQYYICAKYKAKYFPSILAIKSSDPFLQKLYKGNFTESSIRDFVTSIVNPRVLTIQDFSVTDSLIDPQSDASIPLLVTPKKQHQKEKQPEIIAEIAPFISASNRSLYTIEGTSSNQELQLYIAPNCHIPYNGNFSKDSIIQFIYENRFNIYHQYTYEEFSSYKTDQHMILVVSFKGLTEEYSTILSDVASKLCGQFVFGWVNPFSDRRFNVTFKQEPEDPTVFAFIDRNEHRVFKLLKKPDSQLVHQFVLNVTHYYEKGGDWDNGWAIFGAFLLIMIMSTYLIVYNSTYQSCLTWINELCF